MWLYFRGGFWRPNPFRINILTVQHGDQCLNIRHIQEWVDSYLVPLMLGEGKGVSKIP